MNLLEILLNLENQPTKERRNILASMDVDPELVKHIERCFDEAGRFVDSLTDKPIHVARYVPASELFEGFSDLWNEMAESNCPFTWGDNNRSLVTAETILNHLDNCGGIDVPDDFRERCEDVGLQTYIDLEN